MNENYHLTPNEQLLMDVAADANIIITEDIINASREIMHPQSVRNALSSMASKGYLFRVKRGIYLRCEGTGRPVIEDPNELALLIFKGYIGFSSALQHWDLIEYESFDVFVVTQNKSGYREIGEYAMRAVAMGEKAQGMLYDGGIYVSTLEKTIFDCIYKPQHAGGYPLVVKAISESTPDWGKVHHWFQLLASRSLFQRAGYVLSKAGNAPGWLLKDFRSKVEHRSRLDPSGKSRGCYINEWKLIDNAGVWKLG